MICIEGHTIDETLLKQDSIVVDVGTNNGLFAQTMVEKCGAFVECYEPDLHMFLTLSANFLHDHLKVHQRAVAAHSGIREFYCASPCNLGNSLFSTHQTFVESQSPRKTVYKVFAVSLESIIRSLRHIDLLKLDCEGAEIEILLETPADALRRVEQLSVEFHKFCIPEHSLDLIEKVFCRLHSLGFDGPKDPSQVDLEDCLFVRPEARLFV